MKTLEVTLEGLFQSFRLPLAFKYQRTLRFPPPTTLFGLLGSVLGKDAKFTHYELPKQIKIACIGQKAPINRDLMTYRAIQGKSVKPEVIEREFIPFINLSLFIHAEEELLQELENAFYEPVGAMVLGRADELITAKVVKRIEVREIGSLPSQESIYFRPGLYPGNIRDMLDFKVEQEFFSRYEAPESFSLPNGFEYIDNLGTRKVNIFDFKEFTQLTSKWPAKKDKLDSNWKIHNNENFIIPFTTLDRRNS